MLDNHGFGLENAKSALAKRDVSSMTLEDALLLITAKQEEEEDNEKNEDNRNDNDKILQSFLTSRQTSGRRHQSLRSIRSSLIVYGNSVSNTSGTDFKILTNWKVLFFNED